MSELGLFFSKLFWILTGNGLRQWYIFSLLFGLNKVIFAKVFRIKHKLLREVKEKMIIEKRRGIEKRMTNEEENECHDEDTIEIN